MKEGRTSRLKPVNSKEKGKKKVGGLERKKKDT